MNTQWIRCRFKGVVSGYVFLCVTQVQKIRKALEKIGLEKEFQFMSMENLKVTKCWRVKDFKTQSSKCVRNAYLCVCVRLVQWRSSRARRGE